MEVAIGTVLCRKTTGELCIVLNITDAVQGLLHVRRPVMTAENGINHVVDDVYTYELETVEDHLRHEAKEMVLKQTIQEEMMQALENNKKKQVDVLVN